MKVVVLAPPTVRFLSTVGLSLRLQDWRSSEVTQLSGAPVGPQGPPTPTPSHGPLVLEPTAPSRATNRSAAASRRRLCVELCEFWLRPLSNKHKLQEKKFRGKKALLEPKIAAGPLVG